MKRLNVDVGVGVLLVAGFLAFAYLAVRLGDLPWLQQATYSVTADFTSVSDFMIRILARARGLANPRHRPRSIW